MLELFQTRLDRLPCNYFVIYINNAADVLLLALNTQQLSWGTRCLPCESPHTKSLVDKAHFPRHDPGY